MLYQTINPKDGKVLKTFPELDDAQLETAIRTAASCFEVWRKKTFAQRAAIVTKASTMMHARVDDFARLATLEMGKRIDEARGEVEFSSRILEYYAKNAERFLAPVNLHPTVGEAHMESSPIGVVFGVEPWNFPFYQLARVAGPQLMAGNVVMIKHSESVPQCGMAFEALWRDAGAPAGLYTNLVITHDQAARVVDDPRVKGVALTGSVGAGKILAGRAGKDMKVSSMELGGSDAFIVLDDADLEHTIKWAVWGRMYNAGQTCCAAKRFIVVEKLADAFLQKFQAAMAGFTPGDPMDEKTTLGPLVTEAALLRLLKQVDVAVSKGAKVLMGGKRFDGPGSFMTPTILTDIAPDSRRGALEKALRGFAARLEA
jgi:succinate-semialdehyde dehydrogenase/glutarate-semialdehyde dehydrogenase